MRANKTGTMYLPSQTAVALWAAELRGQLSDGLWENSRPRDHWKFWCHVSVELSTGGKCCVELAGWERPLKTNYAFNRLFEYVGERMLAFGRAARAGWQLGSWNDLQLAAEHMPVNMLKFVHERSLTGYRAEKLQKVSDKQAMAFYAASYTKKDLNADLKLIKQAMRSVGTP